MPNYVTNRLIIKDCDDETFEDIKTLVKGKDTIFDFNRLVQMPKALDIVDGSVSERGFIMYQEFLVDYMNRLGHENIDIRNIPKEAEDAYLNTIKQNDKYQDIVQDIDQYWEIGKQTNLNVQDYGAKSWYDWRINNWGTKWNAINSHIFDDGQNKGFEFDTAWSPPRQVVKALSNYMFNYTFVLEWADEAFGNTCGRETYQDGQVTDEYYPDFGKEQIPIYCKIHGIDPVEFSKEFGFDTDLEESAQELDFNQRDTMFDNLLSKYPVGSRIELESTIEDIHPIEVGTKGTIKAVDDLGTIHVLFDNGRLLGVIPQEDNFRLLTEEEVLAEQIDSNLVDRNELANKLVDFAKDFDTYEFKDNYDSENPDKAFNDIRALLDDETEVQKLKEYFEKDIISTMEDSTQKDQAIEIKDSLNKLGDELSEEYKAKMELEKEKLNKEVLETAKGFQKNPQDIIEFLEFQSKFHNYSIRNQMLIFNQNPHAIFCASFKQHKKQGHIVKKGEHGMKILVPVKKTYLLLNDGKTVNLNDATKEQKAAYHSGTIKSKEYKFFKAGTVFDIAQTNCPKEDYPKFFDIGYQSKQHAQLFKVLKNYCETKLNCPVIEDAYSSVGTRGEYEVSKNEIRISENFDDTTKLSILSHEMGHAMLHKNIKPNEERPISQIEFEADALSIMLSNKMGVEVAESRKEHVSNMLSNMANIKDFNPEMITESLNRANRAYNDVIKEVGKHFEQTHTQEQLPKLANEIEVQNMSGMDGQTHT